MSAFGGRNEVCVYEQFKSLIADLGALCGPAGLVERFQGNNLEVVHVSIDGVQFVLSRSEATPELLTIHCRVGSLTRMSEEMLLRLLAKNIDLASRSAGALGVTQPGRELVYSFLAAVQGTTAQQLLSSLRNCACMAKSWNDEFLVFSPPTADLSPLSASCIA